MNPKISHDMADESIPGAVIEVTPAEAERQGAFVEDAITLADAEEAVIDIAPDEDENHGG